MLDIDGGFAHRPGYYAKLAWQPPVPVRLELFRYDNRADPEVTNDDHEWGWRTQFDNLGIVADLGGGAELRAQALSGPDALGLSMDGRRWVDTRFHSAFAMLTRPFGSVGLAARIEAFDTRNKGTSWTDEYDETGWSGMVAAKRDFGRFTGLVEVLHVSSRSAGTRACRLAPRQDQTQLQASANPLVTMFVGQGVYSPAVNLQPWRVPSCCSRRAGPVRPARARRRCRYACSTPPGGPCAMPS